MKRILVLIMLLSITLATWTPCEPIEFGALKSITWQISEDKFLNGFIFLGIGGFSQGSTIEQVMYGYVFNEYGYQLVQFDPDTVRILESDLPPMVLIVDIKDNGFGLYYASGYGPIHKKDLFWKLIKNTRSHLHVVLRIPKGSMKTIYNVDIPINGGLK